MKQTFIITFSFISFASAISIIGYECNDINTPVTSIALVPRDNCVKNKPNITITQVEVQLVQLKNYDTVKVFSCLATYSYLITQCGSFFTGRNIIIDSYTHVKHLTREQCRQMHDIKFFQDPAYAFVKIEIIENKGYFAGFVIGQPDEGSCKGGVFRNHRAKEYEDVVVHVQISIDIQNSEAQVRLKDNTILINNINRCSYLQRECFAFGGNTFWSLNPPDRLCNELGVIPFFQGQVEKRIETLPDQSTKISFSLADPREPRQFLIEAVARSSTCGMESYVSQNTQIHLIEAVKGNFKLSLKSEISVSNLNPELFHMMKMSQIYKDISAQMNELYAEISFRKCQQDHKIAMNLLYLSKIDSANFAFLIYKQEGIYGRLMGETIHLMNCQPQLTQLRHVDECFSDIPVYYEGKPVFLSPLSRIIKPVGLQISCGGSLRPAFNLNNTWYKQVNRDFIKTEAPSEMTITPDNFWRFNEIGEIANKGIYSAQELQKYRESIQEPVNLETTQNLMTKNFLLNSATSFNPLDTIEVTESDYEQFKRKFIDQWLNSAIDKLREFGIMVAIIIGIIYSLIAVKIAFKTTKKLCKSSK